MLLYISSTNNHNAHHHTTTTTTTTTTPTSTSTSTTTTTTTINDFNISHDLYVCSLKQWFRLLAVPSDSTARAQQITATAVRQPATSRGFSWLAWPLHCFWDLGSPNDVVFCSHTSCSKMLAF